MKATINGKEYNTEKAAALVDWSNNLPRTDLDFAEETLYATPEGEYFLHGTGGPRTVYASIDAGFFCGGEKIIPLPPHVAFKWAKDNVNEKQNSKLFQRLAVYDQIPELGCCERYNFYGQFPMP